MISGAAEQVRHRHFSSSPRSYLYAISRMTTDAGGSQRQGPASHPAALHEHVNFLDPCHDALLILEQSGHIIQHGTVLSHASAAHACYIWHVGSSAPHNMSSTNIRQYSTGRWQRQSDNSMVLHCERYMKIDGSMSTYRCGAVVYATNCNRQKSKNAKRWMRDNQCLALAYIRAINLILR